MRGGSPEPLFLLDGGYMENESDIWKFTAYQIDENDVEIRFSPMSNPRVIPKLNMTMHQYTNVFFPVVDSGVNNHEPLVLRGINYRGLPGSWWSRAFLEQWRQNNANLGGYKRRQRFSAKIVAYEHKKRGHNTTVKNKSSLKADVKNNISLTRLKQIGKKNTVSTAGKSKAHIAKLLFNIRRNALSTR